MSSVPGQQIILAIVCLAIGPVAPSLAEASPGDLLEEFEMAPCSDMITLPVTCHGHTYEFLLDTGSSGNLIDKSLTHLLYDPVGRMYGRTPTGVEAIAVYRTPAASIGNLELDPDDLIACVDLSDFAPLTGRDIRGILGMSFLSRYALQLDFDAGRVRLLESPIPVEEELGHEVELVLEPDSPPKFAAGMVDTMEWTLVLDTGSASTGSIEHRIAEVLEARGLLHPIGLYHGRALTRDFTARRVLLDSLAVGPFMHRDLPFSRTQASVLGLPFLAQYNVTFDFPERRLWLAPSVRGAVPPKLDLSGIAVMVLDDEHVVSAIRPGGPASRAGLEQGDVLLSIGGVPTAGLSVACVREAFRSSMGDTVEVVVSRFGAEFEATLDLRWHTEADSADVHEQPPN